MTRHGRFPPCNTLVFLHDMWCNGFDTRSVGPSRYVLATAGYFLSGSWLLRTGIAPGFDCMEMWLKTNDPPTGLSCEQSLWKPLKLRSMKRESRKLKGEVRRARKEGERAVETLEPQLRRALEKLEATTVSRVSGRA